MDLRKCLAGRHGNVYLCGKFAPILVINANITVIDITGDDHDASTDDNTNDNTNDDHPHTNDDIFPVDGC